MPRQRKERHPVSVSNQRGKRRKGRVGSMAPKHLEFCVNYAIGGLSIVESAINAGFSGHTAWNLWRRPDVRAKVKELEKQAEEDMIRKALKKRALTVGFLDSNLAEVVAQDKPHQFRGYADRVKAIETGYKALDIIKPQPKVSVTQNQAQGQIAGSTNSFDVYESAWKVKKKQEWDRQLEQKYAELPATTQE